VKGLVYVLAGVVAVALTAGLVVGSAIPYTDDPGDGSLIRLSWRAVGKPVEQCREPTEESSRGRSGRKAPGATARPTCSRNSPSPRVGTACT
jgi:hypothetical protein